ncbi:MAG: 3-hydroxyacyl-CoA dehydrogenase NAD-binding domain-containing protein [Ancalomicrobiaceae bacterium]|nr:3-hydroxyacyl-CoA dehydrogenase NAD-binding domain-containing protein [Ancalomicrobiaceae bacterium]
MALPAIAVIGAGLMGHGIAYRLAAAGHEVRVQDPDPAARQALAGKIGDICDLLGTSRSALERISGHADLASAVVGVETVIEAAPERLELKQSIFAALEQATAPGTILASNTSALPIHRIAETIGDRSRVVGAHFWNPPHLVPLVEVVLMGEANRPAAERISALLSSAGWHPVTVNRDIPGFIGNRLQHALKREAIALVAAGVCDAETIDDVVKLGFGARLSVLGPLEQSDLVGLDLTKSIHDTLMPDLDVTAVTHPYLEALIAKGDTGMKAGQGFRRWTPDQAEAVRQRLREFLVSQAQSRRQL